MRLLPAILLLLLLSPPALAQRVALVIGNGAYREVPALANPTRDARAMHAALTRLGFRSDLVLDADRAAMETAIRRFGAAAEGAEAAVVFYAGHAVEVAGRNHLLPVSARIASDRDLPFETIDFDAVLGQLEGRARVILVFLDACRDNPFRQRLAGATRGITALGLAPVRSPVGTLVAFATAPGQVAQDGAGRNSPFTTALLRHIETPGLEVREMMGRVRQAVREATRGAQLPWETASLEGGFYFRPAAALAQPAPVPVQPGPAQAAVPGAAADPNATERLFWDSIRDSRDAAEFQAYLRRYPRGAFVELAQGRIAALSAAARSAPAPRDPAPGAVPAANPALPRPAAPIPATPAPPPAAPVGAGGVGPTVTVQRRIIPLPPGVWREAAAWSELSTPAIGFLIDRSFFIHHRIMVSQDGLARVRIAVTDNDARLGGWGVSGACAPGGGLLRGITAAGPAEQSCWQVSASRDLVPIFTIRGESAPGEDGFVSRHRIADSLNLIEVDYRFTGIEAARLARWAEGTQAMLREGMAGRTVAGLTAP